MAAARMMASDRSDGLKSTWAKSADIHWAMLGSGSPALHSSHSVHACPLTLIRLKISGDLPFEILIVYAPLPHLCAVAEQLHDCDLALLTPESIKLRMQIHACTVPV